MLRNIFGSSLHADLRSFKRLSTKDRFKYKMLDGLSSLLSIIEESSDKKKVIEELLKRKEFKKEVTEVTDK